MIKAKWYWNEPENRPLSNYELEKLEHEMQEASRKIYKKKPTILPKNFWKIVGMAWSKRNKCDKV